MRDNRACQSPVNHDFPEQLNPNRRSKIIMTAKPTATSGRSQFFKKSEKLSTLKLRAERLGLTHYASLYGDKRCLTTWQKLLENEPELEPLQPRPIEKSKSINWKIAIALLIIVTGSNAMIKSLQRKAFPVHIDVKIEFKGQK
jgi:hypothetical protein